MKGRATEKKEECQNIMACSLSVLWCCFTSPTCSSCTPEHRVLSKQSYRMSFATAGQGANALSPAGTHHTAFS